MENTIKKQLKRGITAAVLASVGLSAVAQKFSNTQETALWAPEAIKVDGTLKEWGDLQAYNKSTKIFYTISNDDKNIYLVVRSTDGQTSNKIVAGGLTLTINTDGKKKEKDAYTVTYPIIPRQQRGGRDGGGPGGQGGPPGGGGGFGGGPGGGPGGRDVKPDSATLAAQHKQTIAAAKEIKLSGFKDISDSLISVYNEYGIKAAIGYDAVGNYGYELAIPLKFLNLSVDYAKDIAYNLKVNGITMPNFGGRDGGGLGGQGGGGQSGGGGQGGGDSGGGRGGDGGGRGGGDGGGRGGDGGGRGGGDGGRGGGDGGGRGGDGGGPGSGRNMEMFSPTDFWAKYTVAKR